MMNLNSAQETPNVMKPFLSKKHASGMSAVKTKRDGCPRHTEKCTRPQTMDAYKHTKAQDQLFTLCTQNISSVTDVSCITWVLWALGHPSVVQR